MLSAKECIAIDFWEGLTGAFFCRLGGESHPPFDSLNLSYGVGDEAGLVARNRHLVKVALGLDSLQSARQVHGDRILAIREPSPGDGEDDGYDALITNQPGVGIMVQQADCQAVVLYDPTARVVANVHVGWRGSVANILAKTMQRLRDDFAADPCRVKAAISPSLGPCCAEFVNSQAELPEAFQAYQVRPAYFDFWAITRQQLREAGVLPDHILTTGVCTRCSSIHFSYRREGRTGRSATVVALR